MVPTLPLPDTESNAEQERHRSCHGGVRCRAQGEPQRGVPIEDAALCMVLSVLGRHDAALRWAEQALALLCQILGAGGRGNRDREGKDPKGIDGLEAAAARLAIHERTTSLSSLSAVLAPLPPSRLSLLSVALHNRATVWEHLEGAWGGVGASRTLEVGGLGQYFYGRREQMCVLGPVPPLALAPTVRMRPGS